MYVHEEQNRLEGDWVDRVMKMNSERKVIREERRYGVERREIVVG